MENKTLYILGSKGFAKELTEQISASNLGYTIKGYITLINDELYVNGTYKFSYQDDIYFVLGTGNNKWRNSFLDKIKEFYPLIPEYFPNIATSYSYISSDSILGFGNVFCPFSLVNADAVIGNFNNFNIYSSISHDCTLGSYNVLSPHAMITGNCAIGDNNFFGTNSVITPKVKIGNRNTIGASETLFTDLGNKMLVKNNKVIEKR